MASYKFLMSKYLHVDPHALLNYIELENYAIATTPDGKQHMLNFAELRQPAQTPVRVDHSTAIPVAEKAQKGAGSAPAEAKTPPPKAKKVAKK